MKNFKKVLALVLAVATLLSLATVASALTTSASYKDAATIEKNGQTEAVDVLSAIGVLTGYPDTNFKPDQDITRAEAAKIIAMFDNGSVDISSLYTSANPFVDAKGNWAESYIAYGYKAGIIAGVGKLNFAPNAKLTGVQFLKMLLVVLGYDAKTEGLEGTSWAVNTLYLAKRNGLLDGLDSKFDASANLLRGQAAQIMLNVLKADMVEYGQVFKLTDAQKQLIDKYGVLKDGTYNYITVAGAVDTGKQFMTVWNLKCVDLDDAFMRPGHKWVINSNPYVVIDAMAADVVTLKNTTVKANLVGMDAKMVSSASVTGFVDTDNAKKSAEGPWTTKNFSDFSRSLSQRYDVTPNTNYYDTLYLYTVDASGNYTLTDAQATDLGSIRISAGDPNVYFNDGKSTIPTNEKTQFLVHENDGTYTAVTGYQATALSLTANHCEYVMSGKYASIVYIYDTVLRATDKVVGYVADTSDKSTVTVNGTLYYAYTAYVDGKATTIYSTDKDAFATGKGLYDFQFTTSKDGVVVFTKAKQTASNNVYKVLSCDKNALITTLEPSKAYNVASDVKVYVVNGSTVTAGTLADNVVAGAYIKVVYNATTKTITAIYVVTTNDAGTTISAVDDATTADVNENNEAASLSTTPIG